MTAGRVSSDTITISESEGPRLAADIIPPHDDRLEDLLQGQQELMSLVLAGAPLQDVLSCVVAVVERAFAPARCVVSLVRRGESAIRHQAAASVSPDLLCTVGVAVGDLFLDPT